MSTLRVIACSEAGWTVREDGIPHPTVLNMRAVALRQLLRPRGLLDAAMRVLVVDDEPALRSAVQRALALERYDVALAEDGRAGARPPRRRGARRRRPRHRHAARRRPRGLPAHAPGRRPHAGPDAHRARRDRRPRGRPRRRRRRLPGQALRAARAARPPARAAAARRDARRSACASPTSRSIRPRATSGAASGASS